MRELKCTVESGDDIPELRMGNNVSRNLLTKLSTGEEQEIVEVALDNNTKRSLSDTKSKFRRTSTFSKLVGSLTQMELINDHDLPSLKSTWEAFEGNWIWDSLKCVNSFEIRRAMDGGLEYIGEKQRIALKQKPGKVAILECSLYEFWFESKDKLIRKNTSSNVSQVTARRELTLLNLEREVRQLKKYLCLYTTLLDFRVSPGYEANVYTRWWKWGTVSPPVRVMLVGFIWTFGGYFSGMFSHYFWLFKGLNLLNLLLSITPSAVYSLVIIAFSCYKYKYHKYHVHRCIKKLQRSFFSKLWYPQITAKMILFGWLSLGMRVYYEVVLHDGISFSNVGALITIVHLFFKADVICRDYVCKNKHCRIPIHQVRDKIGKYLIDCEVGLPAECRKPLKEGEI